MKKRLRDRWLVNIGLLAGIGILILILFLGKETPEPPAKTLSSLLPSDINRIEIIRTGKEKITFQKENLNWNMLSPYQAPVDEIQINMLLALKNLPISAEFDKQNISLADFGLAQAATAIQFNNTRLSFGDSHPINKRRYIQLDNKVMLIPDNLDAQLKTSSISFIDRRLIPVGKNIEHIEIDGKVIENSTSPENKSGRIFSQWQAIKANWLSLGTQEHTPGVNIKITLTGQEQPLVYLAQKRDVDLVLMRDNPDLEYHLPKAAIKTLGLIFPKAEK